ncbi:hypothetical protein V3F56_02700 [Moorellaceae bacterium AZ2]
MTALGEKNLRGRGVYERSANQSSVVGTAAAGRAVEDKRREASAGEMHEGNVEGLLAEMVLEHSRLDILARSVGSADALSLAEVREDEKRKAAVVPIPWSGDCW